MVGQHIQNFLRPDTKCSCDIISLTHNHRFIFRHDTLFVHDTVLSIQYWGPGVRHYQGKARKCRDQWLGGNSTVEYKYIINEAENPYREPPCTTNWAFIELLCFLPNHSKQLVNPSKTTSIVEIRSFQTLTRVVDQLRPIEFRTTFRTNP